MSCETYTSNSHEAWYALYTKSRHENAVYEHLDKKEITSFLPMMKTFSHRRDRNKMITVPMFPGYLFVRTLINSEHHVNVLKTPGVVSFVGNKEGPIPVPEDCIESLKILSASEALETIPRILEGEKVMVVAGPFAGVVGILVRSKGSEKVVVNIEALGHSVGVEIARKEIWPASQWEASL